MQLHELQPKHRRKSKKRVGRGGKRGTYSGKGIKGQKSRAGRKFQPLIRQVIKRYPKKRGYRFNPPSQKPAIINVGVLNDKFKKNDSINPKILLQKKLIRKIKGKIPQVKILGKGKTNKPLLIEGCQTSKTAKQKIEQAGGKLKAKS